MIYKASVPIAMIILLICAVSAFGTTYYVDPASGNDTNSGDSSSVPWKHIPGSLTASPSPTMASGDVILVKGGSIQSDSITINSSHYKNGQVGATIQIRSGDLAGWGSGRAVIDGGATPAAGAGTWGKGFWIAGRSYIRIEGFEIRNMASVTDSAGIWIDGASTNDEIVNNLIHDIYGNSPQLVSCGYGIEVTGATVASYILIEKNEIYHCEQKCIELYRQGNCTIRFNNLYQCNQHTMVICSPNNQVYGNVFRQAGFSWPSYVSPVRPAFGFKCEGTKTIFADNNIVYNNIVWDCVSGLGILNGNFNKYYHNTVYYTGYQSNISEGYEGAAFVLRDQGVEGTNVPTGNDVRNNIFYYSVLSSSTAATVAVNTTIGPNNTISRNVIYRDSATTGSLIYWRGSSSWSFKSVDWLQGPSGFTTISTGNVATNNVVLDPQFKAGAGASIVSSAPTGLDSSWHPNTDALSLSASAPAQVVSGDVLGSPFDFDIVGRPRTRYALGAYESAFAAQVPDAPTHLRVK